MFGYGDQSALLRRRGRYVQKHQVRQLFFDALVMRSQREQYLPQLFPSLVHIACTEPFFRINVGRYDDRADDVAELFAGRRSHRAPDGLNHVDGAFARL